MYLKYLEKPTVNCFACMKLNSLEEAQGAVKEKMAHSEYCFAIVLRDTGKVIGEIEAHPESSNRMRRNIPSPPRGLRRLSHRHICGKTSGIY